MCALAVSAELLLSGGMDGSIKLWGVDGMEPRGVLLAGGVSGHAAEINQLLFVGERILSASSDRAVKVWEPVSVSPN